MNYDYIKNKFGEQVVLNYITSWAKHPQLNVLFDCNYLHSELQKIRDSNLYEILDQ